MTTAVNRRTREIVLRRRIDFTAVGALILKSAICLVLICCTVGILSTFIGMKSKITYLENQCDIKDEKILTLNTEMSQIATSSEELYRSSFMMAQNENILYETIETLDDEIVTLSSDSLVLEYDYYMLLEEYEKISARAELYDKYEYAIMYGGYRTKLNYDDIRLGVELMTENGYDPNIMFGMMGIESSYNPDCKNATSTATGLGQFLSGTGEWVYEELMGNGKGSYSHSMAYDPKLNITMMSVYLDYLMTNNKGDLYKSIRNYCGKDDAGTRWYIGRINSIMGSYGNIYTIAEQYK